MCYNDSDITFNRETGEAKDSRTGRQVYIPNGPMREEPQDYKIDKKGNIIDNPFMDDAIWK
jgi:hypothetical protein